MLDSNSVLITIKNKETHIPKVIKAVQTFLKKTSFSRDFSVFIAVVLDELLSNIIHYGFDDDNSHEITVSADIVKGSFKLMVQDDGREFNPLKYPAADVSLPLDHRKLGGLGIYLVRQIMDNVHYENKDGKNILVLSKAERRDR